MKLINKDVKRILLVFLGFALYFLLDDLYFRDVRTYINSLVENLGISHIFTYIIFGIPLFAFVRFLKAPNSFLSKLGLNRSFIKGFLFSILVTLPMLIGFYFLFEFNSKLTLNTILISGVSAAFFEELYFRGYLFGLTYRYTGLGFFSSILIGSIVFALMHLYQSQDFATLIGIFLTTFVGSIIFAWVYAEWKFNIWVPILIHFFMNIYWMVFDVSDNALGDFYSNIFRVISILLIVLFTLLAKWRKGEALSVNKGNFFLVKKYKY